MTTTEPVSGQKRKSAIDEIEVDLSLPEPPSKRCRRLLRKGKSLPVKPSLDDNEEVEPADTHTEKSKISTKKRSEYGIWVGNLGYHVKVPHLEKFFVENSGGAITLADMTRVNLPRVDSSKATIGPDGRRTRPNKGFAYVDFTSYEACVAAVALSETEMDGRKLLIKDHKNFDGRPEEVVEEEREGGERNGLGEEAEAGGRQTGQGGRSKVKTSNKIFVGNLDYNVNENILRRQFAKCGKIKSAKIATFQDTGKCKGFGWVTFETPEAAAAAVMGFVKITEEFPQKKDNGHVKEDKDEEKQDKDACAEDAEMGGGNGAHVSKDDESSPKPKSNPRQAKTTKLRKRKWWVNRIAGRELTIQLAEDDKVRYDKRFRRGNLSNPDKSRLNRKGKLPADKNEEATVEVKDAQRGGKSPHEREKGQPAEAKMSYAQDVSVARLTGAAVAPKGEKITFH